MSARVPRIAGPKAINQKLKDLFEAISVNGAEVHLNPQAVTNQLTTMHGIFDWLENSYAEVKLEICSDFDWLYPQHMILSLTDWSTKRNTT